MKKYTNKILIIVLAAFLLAFTIRFFVIANNIKKEIQQFKTTNKTEPCEESETIELNININ